MHMLVMHMLVLSYHMSTMPSSRSALRRLPVAGVPLLPRRATHARMCSDGTIAETITGLQGPESGGFSQFVDAVAAAGIDLSAGEYTVLAPSDSAFDEHKMSGGGAITEDILKYHIIPGRKSVDQLNVDQPTLQGRTLTAYRQFRKNHLDGAVIGSLGSSWPADVACSNGIIHAIDIVLVPGAYQSEGEQIASLTSAAETAAQAEAAAKAAFLAKQESVSWGKSAEKAKAAQSADPGELARSQRERGLAIPEQTPAPPPLVPAQPPPAPPPPVPPQPVPAPPPPVPAPPPPMPSPPPPMPSPPPPMSAPLQQMPTYEAPAPIVDFLTPVPLPPQPMPMPSPPSVQAPSTPMPTPAPPTPPAPFVPEGFFTPVPVPPSMPSPPPVQAPSTPLPISPPPAPPAPFGAPAGFFTPVPVPPSMPSPPSVQAPSTPLPISPPPAPPAPFSTPGGFFTPVPVPPSMLAEPPPGAPAQVTPSRSQMPPPFMPVPPPSVPAPFVDFMGPGQMGPSAPMPTEFGAEAPMPGREQEYGTDQNAAQPGGANAPPPPIDAESRSRSPGMQRNFYDTAITDFKRPYGSSPTGPEAPPAGAGASSTGPAPGTPGSSPFGGGGEQFGAPQQRPPPVPNLAFDLARSAARSAFEMLKSSQAPDPSQPPRSTEPVPAWRRSLPSLSLPKLSLPPLSMPSLSLPSLSLPSLSLPSLPRPEPRTWKAPDGFGEESPAPGREVEYEAFKGGAQDEGSTGDAPPPPPPIDAERKGKSPGLQRNFYETATADFKQPYGSSPAAPDASTVDFKRPYGSPPPPAAPDASSTGLGGSGKKSGSGDGLVTKALVVALAVGTISLGSLGDWSQAEFEGQLRTVQESPTPAKEAAMQASKVAQTQAPIVTRRLREEAGAAATGAGSLLEKVLLNAKATDGKAVVEKPTPVAEKAVEQPVAKAVVAPNNAAPQGSLGSAADKAAEANLAAEQAATAAKLAEELRATAAKKAVEAAAAAEVAAGKVAATKLAAAEAVAAQKTAVEKAAVAQAKAANAEAARVAAQEP